MESSRQSRSVPLDAIPSILVCITIADVRKGCGWPTFRSGVRTIESAPNQTVKQTSYFRDIEVTRKNRGNA